MTFFELFLIGIGLSMDAFAVSICKGLSMQKIDKKYTLCIGLFFGGFQALMPLTGYLLGSQFSGYIARRQRQMCIRDSASTTGSPSSCSR